MMLRGRTLKIVAAYFLLSFVFEIIRPTLALALTGGPSQPEMQSFEPFSTTNMVDLFSGDFTYNIPLLTVPGPNGGYPVNLAYHGGIGMEQEASWVGLGWNVNVGAINRNMRGIPDDFLGAGADKDQITRTMNMRPDATYSIGFNPNVASGFFIGDEFYGADLKLSQNFQIYSNTYRGVGIRYGLGLNVFSIETSSTRKSSSGITGSISLTFDSQKGVGFSPSLSSYSRNRRTYEAFNVGASFHSRQGIQGMQLGYSSGSGRRFKTNVKSQKSASLGVDFSRTAYVPGLFAPMTGIQVGLNLEPGTTLGGTIGTWKRIGFYGLFISNWIKDDHQTFTKDAYGYLNSQYAGSDPQAIMDLNRDKDVPMSPRVPTTPMPVATYDTYQVMGQGTGGVFRPYRSDVGILHDESMSNETNGVTAGFEFGAGTDFKAGIDLSLRYSYSYSGNWQNGSNLNVLDFSGTDTDDPLYEPAYFKMSGELTANDTTFMDEVGGERAIRFRLSLLPIKNTETGYTVMQPQAHNQYTSSGSYFSSNYTVEDPTRDDREQRVTNIEYRTRQMVTNHDEWGLLNDTVWEWDENPVDNAGEGSKYAFNSNLADHHITEIEVVNPDGMRYIYDLPAINYRHDEVSFAKDGIAETAFPATVSYTAGTDNSVDNTEGIDHYFNRTAIDPYVHGHMLRAVVSPDYVDLTGDGLSEDDFGYYTKFNYAHVADENDPMQWRVPFKEANYSKGYYSNEFDDKASYTYGEKDLYLLNSIETKTHIAVFILGLREDGTGVESENQSGVIGSTTTANRTYYLDKIELYAKEDLTTPLQTVHFAYTYDLCRDVYNNTGKTDTDINKDGVTNSADNLGGKLTLKRVWFTYLGNDKGELSPYEFDYNESTTNSQNPAYDELQMDRWGNYKPDDSGGDDYMINTETPYVNQQADFDDDGDIDASDTAIRNDYASAWCLRSITLPSGGQIDVEYEADHYAYVQDERATQMMQIAGFDDTEGADPSQLSDLTNTMSNDNLRVYFKLEEPIDVGLSPTQKKNLIYEYIEGVDEIYFKTYQRLKKEPEGGSPQWQYDYVEGYAQVDKSSTDEYGVLTNGVADHLYGYITLEAVDYGLGNAFHAHPMKFAGWQYIKTQRPDLFNTPDAEAGTAPEAALFWNLLSSITELGNFLLGYYNMASAKGWCKKLNVEDKPSFIRLNTPDKIKYGGGQRVSQLTISDNWSAVEGYNASYGQTFEYRNEDGTSSGVAIYEPLIGGEEIALRKPVWYNGNQKKISFRSEDAFIEKPYGEAYYPGASVGYGRVVVRNTVNTAAMSKNNPGYQVHEFYTAKDFPVVVAMTDLEYRGQNNPITIPLIGYIGKNTHSYSQGYKIELNNMHGVQKAVSVYGYGTDFSGEPMSKTEYFYSTNPNNSKLLYNRVEVLDGEGAYREAYLGQTYDFFIDQDQHSSYALTMGMAPNVQGQAIVWIPTLFTINEYDENIYKAVVTNKIIYKTGILTEVRQTTDGSTRVTKNHMFDARTGAPLLTSVTNEWEEPVYTYSMPAHWAYQGTDAAADNWGMQLAVEPATGNNTYGIDVNGSTYSDADLYIQVGCEITDGSGNRYFVTAMDDDGTFDLENNKGVDPGIASTTTFWISRSSHRNQQGVNMASIVSLDNPVTDRYFQVFEEFNLDIEPCTSACINVAYSDSCGAGNIAINMDTIGQSSDGIWEFNIAQGGCQGATLSFLAGTSDDPYKYEILTESYDRITGLVQLQHDDGTTSWAQWDDPNGCFTECLDVLHADATTFRDDWTYNYADVGDPTIDNGVDAEGPISSTAGNDYRFGKKGIWRPETQFVHQIDRLQTEDNGWDTRTDLDGEYELFTLFNWNDLSTNYSNNWLRTDSITMYSPYGFALESMNAIDVYSSEMYGYDNSVVTATAANSAYMEMAFDGLEDYSGTYVLNEGHGHLDLTDDAAAPELSSTYAHTGDYSLYLADSDTLEYTFTVDDASPNYFTGAAGEDYVISAWYLRTKGTGNPVLAVYDETAAAYLTTTYSVGDAIEGWQKVDVYMTALEASHDIKLVWSFGSGGAGYVDDIRIHPFDGAQATYVYDPQTLWLVAELDNRNYATYYSYDEEGSLVQVKKETVDGIVTLSTTRQNTSQ